MFTVSNFLTETGCTPASRPVVLSASSGIEISPKIEVGSRNIWGTKYHRKSKYMGNEISPARKRGAAKGERVNLKLRNFFKSLNSCLT